MVEKLAITEISRRGEGLAETSAGPLHVPYTLPGETVTVEDWDGHPAAVC